MKRIFSLFLSLFLIFSLCACKDKNLTEIDNSKKGASSAESVITDVDTSLMDTKFTDNDLDSSVSKGTTEIKDDIVKITKDGSFTVSGKHSQIIVDASDTAKPQIILNNAKIDCTNGPAIYIINADKVFITIPENTTSTISDGSEYSSNYDNADGAIFSKADLTVNGAGKLKINGNYKCGIVSKDDLVISETVIEIESTGAAIEGKDCVKLNNPTLTLNAGGDGIKSTNNEDATRGFIYATAGKYDITAVNDALQAETALMIDGGDFTLKTGGGSSVSSSSGNNNWGMWGGYYGSSSSTDTESAKALKATVLIKITDGKFNINSSDDAIHSNSDIEIGGGTFEISSGDDGIHADDALLVNGGKFNISKSYEGLEATVITVTGGEIDVTASDDGFNAAGGNDSSALGGRPGQNPFDSDSDASININGGYILVNASGDGIDSNGSITMNGGILLVSGPENSGNGAFDYGISATINGGTAVIVGSSGMAQSFSSSSGQASFIYTLDSYQSGGTSVSISEKNNVFASFIPAKKYNSVIISCPNLSVGSSYNLNLGGTVTNTDANGYTSDGTVNNPQSTIEISISSISTSYGNSGSMGNHGGGGMGGHGGFGRP